VRADAVVVLPPLPDQGVDLPQREEDIPVQELISQLSVQGFHVTVLPCQLDDPGHKPRLVGRDSRPMALRRPCLPQYRTGPTLGDTEVLAYVHDASTPPGRAQKFPELTSLRIALPRACSATAFFSRAF
jgi:hypothetical protein